MKLRAIAAVISWMLTVAWMLMIFLLSAQPATESSKVSSSVTEIVVSVVVPDFEALPHEEQQAILDLWHDPIRKIAHLTEYAILGFLLMLSSVLSRLPIKPAVFIAIGASLLYAISDEIHQNFAEARGPGVGDVLIDLCGAAIGTAVFLAVYMLIWHVYRKRKEKISEDT